MDFISGWELHGLHCYQFFNVRHSWQKASELCKRYGSDLATVDSFAQNNFTSQLAQRFLSGTDGARYWLGLRSHNDLQTNTLQTDAGDQIPLYHGHWAVSEPDTSHGECVEARLIEAEDGSVRQEWSLFNCDSLSPFMCRLAACPSGTFHCSNGKCISRQHVCDGKSFL